ncbi:MAG: SH3 domain-containing protein [Spirochaetes bacterium]|nr:SH3 domain-containing protein [Spirochaetota bacterium]
MKKGAIIGIIAGVLAILIAVAAAFFFSGDDLGSAIDDFESGDFKDAIIMLNRLARTADYDAGEKIFYYRCRAINGLAFQLEKKFSDELEEAAQERKNDEEYAENVREIKEYLARLNKEIDGDLAFIPAMKRGRIAPRGKFYDEFHSRYRGSALVEDLRFEQVLNMGKSEPEKLVPAMIRFYNDYPNTDYIARMIQTIFDGLRDGSFTISGSEETVWRMILTYIRRYPTSPETGKLYSCSGDNVNLRSSPGVEGQLVGKIARDEILIQLEKSMDTTQVGDTRDFWYRVASLRGPRGWIFGKFIAPVDLAKYADATAAVAWTREEHFNEWSDSHTPVEWSHVPGGDRAGINFSVQNGKKIVMVDSAKGSTAGLYARHGTTRSFAVETRARFTGGDAVTVVAYCADPAVAFTLALGENRVVVAGRTIPLPTSEWKAYLLASDDGRFATLSIDGETVSSRIEPIRSPHFTRRGVYCLFSSKDEHSKGEIEYIKIR